MDLYCNGQSVGSIEHVEWKEEGDEGGTVTFMVPFDFDWDANQGAFLEIAEPDGDTRYMLPQIKRIDEGGTGDFVVARYKQIGG